MNPLSLFKRVSLIGESALMASTFVIHRTLLLRRFTLLCQPMPYIQRHIQSHTMSWFQIPQQCRKYHMARLPVALWLLNRSPNNTLWRHATVITTLHNPHLPEAYLTNSCGISLDFIVYSERDERVDKERKCGPNDLSLKSKR